MQSFILPLQKQFANILAFNIKSKKTEFLFYDFNGWFYVKLNRQTAACSQVHDFQIEKLDLKFNCWTPSTKYFMGKLKSNQWLLFLATIYSAVCDQKQCKLLLTIKYRFLKIQIKKTIEN